MRKFLISALLIFSMFLTSATSYCKTSGDLNLNTILNKQDDYEFYIACPTDITLRENIDDIGKFYTNFVVRTDGTIPDNYFLKINVRCSNSEVKNSSLTQGGQVRDGWGNVAVDTYAKLGTDLISKVEYESLSGKLDQNTKILISVNIGGN